MKLAVETKLLDVAGKEIVVSETDATPVTLRFVCVHALLNPAADEALDGVEKFKRAELAKRMYDNAEPELSVEEVAKIKMLVGKIQGPGIVYPTFQLLEGK